MLCCSYSSEDNSAQTRCVDLTFRIDFAAKFVVQCSVLQTLIEYTVSVEDGPMDAM